VALRGIEFAKLSGVPNSVHFQENGNTISLSAIGTVHFRGLHRGHCVVLLS